MSDGYEDLGLPDYSPTEVVEVSISTAQSRPCIPGISRDKRNTLIENQPKEDVGVMQYYSSWLGIPRLDHSRTIIDVRVTIDCGLAKGNSMNSRRISIN